MREIYKHTHTHTSLFKRAKRNKENRIGVQRRKRWTTLLWCAEVMLFYYARCLQYFSTMYKFLVISFLQLFRLSGAFRFVFEMFCGWWLADWAALPQQSVFSAPLVRCGWCAVAVCSCLGRPFRAVITNQLLLFIECTLFCTVPRVFFCLCWQHLIVAK